MEKRSLTALAAAAAVLLGGCTAKGMTAEEWILSRYDVMNVVEMYCGELDDVVGIYVSGGMTEEQFSAETAELKKEFDMMKSERKEEKIKVGTHTESTKLGEEGYEDAWKHLEALTNALAGDETLLDANKLAYFCMAYSEALSEDFEKYYAAYFAAGGTVSEEAGAERSEENGS